MTEEARAVVVITGGRDRTPSLAELERLEITLLDLGATTVRHGACPPSRNDRDESVGSTDMLVAGYLGARKLVEVEAWPADWSAHGRAAGPRRNRAMISGVRPGELVPRPRAGAVISFDGGRGTQDCRVAALEAGMTALRIYPVEEPQPWNRHMGKPPGPSVYCGHGTPVGNPFKDDGDASASLGKYADWLRSRIASKSPQHDPRVVEWLRAVSPQHYLICSCWPRRCHAELLVKAWRWLHGKASPTGT